ncbi:hypothetical protein [Acinetobacter larvae]|uniref:Uncharacterized protein n=1 Tax=Acinetobacter larvae TaxID=1789224 RepID=A0A1B2M2Q6_9GAMM|nr:hypothetical protein [Acinetobacter larvae]AOA59475.1 hypothetical protein BFG52_14720 [Acinetobacter larvae]
MLTQNLELLDIDAKESNKTKKIMRKSNEPGACGIDADRIDDFNSTIISFNIVELLTKKKRR